MYPFPNSDPNPGQGTSLIIGAKAVHQPSLTPQLGAFVQGRQGTKIGEKEDCERGGLGEKMDRMAGEVGGLMGAGSKGECLCVNGSAHHWQKD